MNRGIFLNFDNTHFLHSRYQAGIHPDEEHLREFVRQYEGTQVTDLLFCIGGRISDFPSKLRMSWLDKYHQTVENGIPVDYRQTYLAVAQEMWEEKGLDPFAIWLQEARRCGICPWLSLRMNDAHENPKPTSCLHSDYFHLHPELRRVRHREPIGYGDRLFDYGKPEIQERVYAFLKEILERYEPDGLELDFMRESLCFAPGQEDPEIMTALLRKVRALADRVGERAGRRIAIAVRLPADPRESLELGFDVALWAEEGLADVIIPTGRWYSTDNDMPIAVWKRLLRGTETRLAPGIEINLSSFEGAPMARTDEEHVLGAASQYYALGADAVYLYNYYDDPDVTKPYWKSGAHQTRMAVRPEGMKRLLSLLGDPQLVNEQERKIMLTYRDVTSVGRSVFSELPRHVSPNRPAYFRLATGSVGEGFKVHVAMGMTGEEIPRVWLDSRPCRFLYTEENHLSLTDDPVFVFETEPYPETYAVPELLSEIARNVSYLEIRILKA